MQMAGKAAPKRLVVHPTYVAYSNYYDDHDHIMLL